MKNFLAVIGGIVVGFFLLLAIVYMSNVYNFRKAVRSQPTPPPVEDTLRTPAPGEIRNYYTAQRLKSLLSQLQMEFKEAEITWKYDDVNGFFYFNIVSPNIDTVLADSAREGDRIAQTAWDSFVRQISTIQRGIQRTVTNQDDPTCIVFNVYDPRDRDLLLLSVANGVAGYDIVTGVDLEHGG